MLTSFDLEDQDRTYLPSVQSMSLRSEADAENEAGPSLANLPAELGGREVLPEQEVLRQQEALRQQLNNLSALPGKQRKTGEASGCNRTPEAASVPLQNPQEVRPFLALLIILRLSIE